MTHKYPKYFFIDAQGKRHIVHDDFSSTFPHPFSVNKNIVEVMDSKGFVIAEFILQMVEEVAA